MWFDTAPARDELGWRARWSNEEMLCDSYDWFLADQRDAVHSGASAHRRTASRVCCGWPSGCSDRCLQVEYTATATMTNQQSANTSSIRSRRASSSGSSAVPRSTSRA